MKNILTREQILNSVDIVTEEVSCPEWGGSVLVRGMTGYEREAYESDMAARRLADGTIDIHGLRGRMAARTVVNGDGERIFTDDDIDVLSNKNAAPLDRIYDVVCRLSRITESEVAEAEERMATDPSDTSSSP